MMGLDAPAAFEDGRPVAGQVLVEIRPDAAKRTRLLANRVHKPYPAADVDEPGARLLVKDWEDGPYRELPRSAWRFAEETDAGVVPSAAHITVEAGMEPGKIYHVVYTTDHAPVVGAGLLAVRDAAAWLKHGDRELAPSGFAYAHAYGVSQTGRLLRHLLYLGLERRRGGAAGVRRPARARRRRATGRVQPALRPAVRAVDSGVRPPLPVRGQRTDRLLLGRARRPAETAARRRRRAARRLHQHLGGVLARRRLARAYRPHREGTTSTKRRSRARTSSPARSTP